MLAVVVVKIEWDWEGRIGCWSLFVIPLPTAFTVQASDELGFELLRVARPDLGNVLAGMLLGCCGGVCQAEQCDGGAILGHRSSAGIRCSDQLSKLHHSVPSPEHLQLSSILSF